MDGTVHVLANVNRIPAAPTVRVTNALALWGSWSLDIPPTGSTGNAALDRKLSDAFRSLAALPTAELRFTWIEREVFSTSDFPSPNAPTDRYRETLMRWWMELFDTD